MDGRAIASIDQVQALKCFLFSLRGEYKHVNEQVVKADLANVGALG